MSELLRIRDEVLPAVYRGVLPSGLESPEATVMLLAIGLQESRFEHRKQIGGPAHSYWQFEKGGGVKGVMTHPVTTKRAKRVCEILGVHFTQQAVYTAMLIDDLLGCAFARLLLLSDPRPLPALGDVSGAWNYYTRNWRPGKPHIKTWPDMYEQARRAMEQPHA